MVKCSLRGDHVLKNAGLGGLERRYAGAEDRGDAGQIESMSQASSGWSGCVIKLLIIRNVSDIRATGNVQLKLGLELDYVVVRDGERTDTSSSFQTLIHDPVQAEASSGSHSYLKTVHPFDFCISQDRRAHVFR